MMRTHRIAGRTARARAAVPVALIIGFVFIGGPGLAQAATRTWNGPVNGAWDWAANWVENAVPTTGDDLVFSGGGSSTSFNNLPSVVLRSITFNADHHLYGGFLLTDSLNVGSGRNVFLDGGMALPADQTWTIGANALVTFGSGGAFLDLNGHALTLTGDTGGVLSFDVPIDGTGSIAKTGDFTLILKASNTFSGQLNITQGTVLLQNSGNLGTEDGTPQNGTTVADGAVLEIQGVSTVAEALTLSGDGPQDVGALIVSSGVPTTMSGPIALAANTTVKGNQVITITGAISGPGDLVIEDTTSIRLLTTQNTFAMARFSGTQAGTLIADVTNALTDIAGVDLQGTATLDLRHHTTTLKSLTGTGTVTGGNGPVPNLIINNAAANTFSGTITLVTTLYKQGAGELVLGGANSHAGQTQIQAGTLRITHANALGAGDGTYVSPGAQLIVDGVSTLDEYLSLQGTDATLRVNGMTPLTLSAGLTIGANAVITGTAGANVTLTGIGFSNAPFAIDTIAFHSANANTIWAGTMTVRNGAVYDVAIGGSHLENTRVALDGGTLQTNGTTITIGGVTGTGTLALGTGGTTIVAPGLPSTFTGAITGSGLLRVDGFSKWTINSATAFTGTVNVKNGELILAHAQAFETPAISVDVGGTLTWMAAATHTGSLSVTGIGQSGAVAGLKVLGGNVTVTGPTIFGSPNTGVVVNTPHALRLEGPTAGDNLYVNGTGAFVLAGNTTAMTQLYIGSENPFASSATTVRLGSANALPSTTVIVLDDQATFDVGGFAYVAKNLSGQGRVETGTASGSLTLEDFSTASFMGTFGGPGSIVLNPPSQNFYSVLGTHTLTGSLTAHGPLAVRATIPATINLDGQISTIDPASVIGPLKVIRSSSALVTIGNVASTDAPTVGDLTLNSQTALDLIVTAATPRLSVHGTVTLAGHLALSEGNTPVPTGPIVLIDNDGTDPVAGTFEEKPEGEFFQFNGVWYRISYAGGDGNDVVITPPSGETYQLAEGATGTFFDTDILIANPNAYEVPIKVQYLLDTGDGFSSDYTLDPMSRLTIHVDDLEGLESAAFSTIVTPLVAAPLVVERTMRWDVSGYGAHTEKATAGPASTWYFAEGSEGWFRTFLLLANPQTEANVAHVTYLREGLPAVARDYALAARSRRTIQAVEDPELVNTSFGMTVVFDRPGVAERAMYFGENPVFKGGHESAGATETSTTWFLAEGATGGGFDTFILVSNPGDAPADVTLTFLPESGSPASITRTVAGKSRLTVNPEGENLAVPEGPLATQVTSTQPVIAERAQYWPGGPTEWTESHNSFGVTAAGLKWALAEGRVGGPEGYQTYILLANAGTEDATVTLTSLGDDNSDVPPPKSVVVPKQSRVNVFVERPFDPDALPDDPAMNVGTLIVSDKPIVVERALYWNVNGEVWAAGTNATATRLS